jgi:3-oxoadipate enol-lactonase
MSLENVTVDDGVKLRVQVDGPKAAAAVLFSHSVGCDMTLWDDQFDALRTQYRVIRYDARGHGGSDVPDGDYKLDRLRRDALAVLDWADVDRAHLIGLSLGGSTALALALRSPERLRSLVLSNASARLGTAEGWQSRMDAARADGMESMADFSMTRFFSEAFQREAPETVARFRAGFAATAAAGYAGCCAVLRDADFTPNLASITTPTLVIGGQFDRPTPPADAQLLADRIAGAQLRILPVGHLANIEAPDAYTTVLQAWLAQD